MALVALAALAAGTSGADAWLLDLGRPTPGTTAWDARDVSPAMRSVLSAGDHTYKVHEKVPLYANKVGPFHNPSEVRNELSGETLSHRRESVPSGSFKVSLFLEKPRVCEGHGDGDGDGNGGGEAAHGNEHANAGSVSPPRPPRPLGVYSGWALAPTHPHSTSPVLSAELSVCRVVMVGNPRAPETRGAAGPLCEAAARSTASTWWSCGRSACGGGGGAAGTGRSFAGAAFASVLRAFAGRRAGCSLALPCESEGDCWCSRPRPACQQSNPRRSVGGAIPPPPPEERVDRWPGAALVAAGAARKKRGCFLEIEVRRLRWRPPAARMREVSCHPVPCEANPRAASGGATLTGTMRGGANPNPNRSAPFHLDRPRTAFA